MTIDKLYDKCIQKNMETLKGGIGVVELQKAQASADRYYNQLRKRFATESDFKAYWESKLNKKIIIGTGEVKK